MKTLQFECKLLSDVILNQKAATEGNNNTLDFIPGSNFLGIVAGKYKDFGDDALTVFHSGKVRFGDAHPVAEGSDLRTLHVAASMFYPKMHKPSEICYIHHIYNRAKDDEKLQLKQCRSGFYAFDKNNKQGKPAKTEKTFAIKSAYNREKRRSEDNKMFGYESLIKGLRLLFEVEVDDDKLADKIKRALIGEHYIGRSRTAQFGKVNIAEKKFEQTESSDKTFKKDNKDYVTVYADGRLIFIDGEGEPTFRPTADDLGIKGGEIDWGLSQVRIFQYAPWNAKRMTRDTDRCGIEKGSVFVVNTNGNPVAKKSCYVGCYRNEGFGKVIYNPDFLNSNGENGKAAYTLCELTAPVEDERTEQKPCNTPLLNYLNIAQKADEADEFIVKEVNKFVSEYGNLFRGEKFASQWGTIRSLAMQYHSYVAINYELFNKTRTTTHTRRNESREEKIAYLTHGVAYKQWDKFGRRAKLSKFISNMYFESAKNGYGDIVEKALVNLASEMAKICKNYGKNKV